MDLRVAFTRHAERLIQHKLFAPAGMAKMVALAADATDLRDVYSIVYRSVMDCAVNQQLSMDDAWITEEMLNDLQAAIRGD